MTQEQIARFFGVRYNLVRRWRAELDLPHKPSLHKLLVWAARHDRVLQSASREEAIDMLAVYRRSK